MIYKRKQTAHSKGTWYVSKRIDGKLIHRALKGAKTRAEAEIAAAKIIADGRPSSHTTFKAFAENVYRKYAHQHNQNTYVKDIFIDLLIAHFGTKKLESITPQDCRDFQYIRQHTPTMHRRKRSNASVNKEMSTLSRILSLAVEHEIIDRNPMAIVKKLREAEPRRRYMTDAERRKLLDAASDDPLMRYLVVLAMNLPLRRAQLLSIQPEDVTSRGLMAEPSKGKGRRLVPLNSVARSTLEEMTRKGLLPFPIRDFRKRWVRITEHAGMPDLHFHDLRHFLGTTLLRTGANPYHIKEAFAHSDMETSSIYISAEFDELERAFERIVSYTSPKPDKLA